MDLGTWSDLDSGSDHRDRCGDHCICEGQKVKSSREKISRVGAGSLFYGKVPRRPAAPLLYIFAKLGPRGYLASNNAIQKKENKMENGGNSRKKQ